MKPLGILLGGTVALLCAAAPANAWWNEKSSIFSIIPSTTPIVLEADAPLLWQASTPLRQQSIINGLTASYEATNHISIEKNMLPWAGHVGIVVTPTSSQKAATHVGWIFEIRDRASFVSALPKIQNASATGKKWKTAYYHGYNVDYLSTARETTVVKNWYVTGDSITVKQIIDTANGTTSSIASSEPWSKATEGLPDDKELFFGLDYYALVKHSNDAPDKKLAKPGKSALMPPVSAETLKLAHLIEANSVSITNNTIRLDSVAVPTTPELKAIMAKEAQSVSAVTSDEFKYVPNDATAAYVYGPLGATWDDIMALELKQISEATKSLPGFSSPDGLPLQQLAPVVVSFLKPYSQGGVLSVVANRANGIGVTFAGITPSPDKAKSAADNLLALLGLAGAQIDNTTSGYSIRVPKSTQVPLDISPSFKNDDNIVRIVSSSKLLGETYGQSKLQLPPEAAGASAVALGNFDFLDLLPKTAATKSTLDTLKISDATWMVYSKIAPDGSSSKGAFVLDNWDYHNGLAVLVKVLDAAVQQDAIAALKAKAKASDAHKSKVKATTKPGK